MASVCSQTGSFSLRRLARETRARPWLTNAKLVGKKTTPSSDAPDEGSPRRVVAVVSASATRFVSRLPVLASRVSSSVSSPVWRSRLTVKKTGLSSPVVCTPEVLVSSAGDSASASAPVVVAIPRDGDDNAASVRSGGCLAPPPAQRRRTRLGLRLKNLGRRAVEKVVRVLSSVSCEKPPGARASHFSSRRPRGTGSVPAKDTARARRPGVKKVTFAENVVICPVDCDAARDSILCELCSAPCGWDHDGDGCQASLEIDMPADLTARQWAASQRELRMAACL